MLSFEKIKNFEVNIAFSKNVYSSRTRALQRFSQKTSFLDSKVGATTKLFAAASSAAHIIILQYGVSGNPPS
jgi:hypothetical protein